MSGKNKRGPESRFYDGLKGQRVKIVLSRDGTDLTAELIWVDRYTLGLRVDGGDVCINKRSIETIAGASGKRIHGQQRGAASR